MRFVWKGRCTKYQETTPASSSCRCPGQPPFLAASSTARSLPSHTPSQMPLREPLSSVAQGHCPCRSRTLKSGYSVSGREPHLFAQHFLPSGNSFGIGLDEACAHTPCQLWACDQSLAGKPQGRIRGPGRRDSVPGQCRWAAACSGREVTARTRVLSCRQHSRGPEPA